MMETRSHITSLLPWDDTREDRLRLWIPAIILLILALLLSVMIEMAPPAERQRYQPQDIPDRLAKFVAEQKKEKEMEPPKPVEQEKPAEEVETEPEPEPEPEPEKAPEVKEKPPAPKEEPTEQQVTQAREAASKRVAVFEDAFAGLRDMAPDTGSGAMSGTSNDLQLGGDEAADLAPGRDLIAVAAGQGSSSSSFISAGRASGKGSIGGQGDGRLAGTGQGGAIGAKVESSLAQGGAASTTAKKASGASGRTDEQIRRVFDRYAGRINSQYQRALRDNPTLQGTVVLNLTIAPDGKVSEVTIKSSELDDDGLLMRIRVIVQSMDFGALSVETWKGTYSLNFFPS